MWAILRSKTSLTKCLLPWRQRMAESSFSLDGNPFGDLNISSWEPLKAVVGRSPCPRCHCSRKFYCYDCYEVVGIDPALIPRVSLPVKVDIIKHPSEAPSKSTAIHARILSPDDIKIYIFPDVPNYAHPSRTVLVFPAKDALTVDALVSEMKQLVSQRTGQSDTNDSVKECWQGIDRVVFVDSTWQTARQILRDERIKALKRVKLSGSAQTYYWRPQELNSSHLATIEAVYYFFREVEAALSKRPYFGEYDNLLYFFAYQHGIVQKAVKQAAAERQEKLRAELHDNYTSTKQ